MMSRDKKIEEIKGTLKRVSVPRTFFDSKGRTKGESFKLGIKDKKGRRILIKLNTKKLGWSGNLHESIVWYRNEKKNRDIKFALKNPERYIGKKIKVRGILTPLNIKDNKYQLTQIKEIVFFL
ncbi:MAG: hypothetical protein GF364_10985 [Candidatus Lokiarchaeota archaeon]|nr:hypothetical protein [Candidatus Lokiarchaeota archaeon]